MNTRLFLGNNGPHGFCGFYNEILAGIGRVYILKGSPASGKSTLIKKIGAEAERKGMRTEYWHCSGDSSSLDGLYIKALDFAVVDGTAPHVVDPTLPVLKERLVPLGDFISREKLLHHKSDMEKLLSDKKSAFSRAYAHLNALYCENRLIGTLRDAAFCEHRCESLALSERAFCDFRGTTRQLFFRAVTPDGVVAFSEFFEGMNVVELQGSDGALSEFFRVLTLGASGFTSFRSPFAPELVEAVAVGSRLYISSDAARAADLVPDTVLELSSELPFERNRAERVRLSSVFAENLLRAAVDELAEAKRNHLAVESFYKRAMNFDALNEYSERLIADIFAE